MLLNLYYCWLIKTQVFLSDYSINLNLISKIINSCSSFCLNNQCIQFECTNTWPGQSQVSTFLVGIFSTLPQICWTTRTLRRKHLPAFFFFIIILLQLKLGTVICLNRNQSEYWRFTFDVTWPNWLDKGKLLYFPCNNLNKASSLIPLLILGLYRSLSSTGLLEWLRLTATEPLMWTLGNPFFLFLNCPKAMLLGWESESH